MKTNTSETITPETIRFATSACSLGSFVIAVSAQGVCALALADDTEALFQELRDDFPSAQLVEDPANLKAEIAAAFATLESPRTPFLLPLDLRGSTFQQNVWGALSKVPVGRTTTYADIATKIGSPDAVRAVGTACGANKIAVMIPCHRVLRQDGVLSGYRWGVDRKRALLSKEVSE